MLKITFPDGSVAEADGAESEQRLLEAVSTKREVYTVKTLARHLDIAERNAYDLIRNGDIRYVCAGKKNYRISHQAVCEYLGDMPSLIN